LVSAIRGVVEICCRFGGTHCFHLQDRRVLDVEDWWIFTTLHSVASQKAWFLITAMRAYHLTYNVLLDTNFIMVTKYDRTDVPTPSWSLGFIYG